MANFQEVSGVSNENENLLRMGWFFGWGEGDGEGEGEGRRWGNERG